MKENTKGSLILLLTAILWGSGFISQKFGNEVMPPMAFNALRQIFAFFVLIPFAHRSLKKSHYLSTDHNSEATLQNRRTRLTRAGILCGIFLLIGSMCQQIGLVTVSAGKSGFITALYIVIVPFFGIFLGNKVKLKSFLCIILALFGFGVMSLQGGLTNTTPGDWWTLLSAAGFAAQIVCVNYFVDKDNAILITELEMIVAGVIGIIVSLIVEGPTLAQVWAGMPYLAYQTLVPTAIGFTLQMVGQKHTEASTAALIMSLEAVFAAIFGVIVLKEMMSTREIIGSAIIFVATAIGQKED